MCVLTYRSGCKTGFAVPRINRHQATRRPAEGNKGNLEIWLCPTGAHVRFGSQADICNATGHVRFASESGHLLSQASRLRTPQANAANHYPRMASTHMGWCAEEAKRKPECQAGSDLIDVLTVGDGVTEADVKRKIVPHLPDCTN